jgi:hypothetical protein
VPARRLVQSVDVLRDDRLQLARLLQLGQRQVRGIGLGVAGNEVFAVVAKKQLRVPLEKRVR